MNYNSFAQNTRNCRAELSSSSLFEAGIMVKQSKHRKVLNIMAIEGYCVKCKEKREMTNPVESTMKNGRPITKGSCPECGTTICRIGSTKK